MASIYTYVTQCADKKKYWFVNNIILRQSVRIFFEEFGGIRNHLAQKEFPSIASDN